MTIEESLETTMRCRPRSRHRQKLQYEQDQYDAAPTAKEILADIAKTSPIQLFKFTAYLKKLAKVKLPWASDVTITALLSRSSNAAHARRVMNLLKANPDWPLTDAIEQTR